MIGRKKGMTNDNGGQHIPISQLQQQKNGTSVPLLT